MRIDEGIGILQRSAEANPPQPDDNVSEEDLARINRLSRVPLKGEDVYVRSMYLCSDRLCPTDWGRFTRTALSQISDLVVGRAVLRGHDRSSLPLARFFSADVVKRDGGSAPGLKEAAPERNEPVQEGAEPAEGPVQALGEVNEITREPTEWVRAWFYWLRGTTGAEDLRLNIDGGVYREVSISWRYRQARCSVCGDDIRRCGHTPGRLYLGKRCFFEVDEVLDVLEGSFVYRGAEGDAAIARERDVQELVFEADDSIEDVEDRTAAFEEFPLLRLLSRLPRTVRTAVVAGPGEEISAARLVDLGIWVREAREPDDRGSGFVDPLCDWDEPVDLLVLHETIDSTGRFRSAKRRVPTAEFRIVRGFAFPGVATRPWERSVKRILERLGYRSLDRVEQESKEGTEVSLLVERTRS